MEERAQLHRSIDDVLTEVGLATITESIEPEDLETEETSREVTDSGQVRVQDSSEGPADQNIQSAG